MAPGTNVSRSAPSVTSSILARSQSCPSVGAPRAVSRVSANALAAPTGIEVGLPSHYNDAVARLESVQFRTSYGQYHGAHPKQVSPVARVRPPVVDVVDISPEEEAETKARFYTTSYRRMFPNYGDDAKPGVSQKRERTVAAPNSKDAEAARQRETAHWDSLRRSQESLDANLKGANERKTMDIKLTAACKPPTTDMHAVFVGGMPPISWKSDARANLNVMVHSKSINARFGNPTPVAVLCKYKYESGSV